MIFLVISLAVMFHTLQVVQCFRSGKCFGQNTCDSRARLFVQTAPELKVKEESEPSEIRTATLKVPSYAWRWPPAWPFPNEFLDPVTVNGTDITNPTYGTFLYHFEGINFDANTLTLFVAPKSFLDWVENSKNFQSLLKSPRNKFLSIEELVDTSEIYYSDEYFDRIAVLAGIESLAQPKSVYKDIWRVLKPGGTCISYFNGKTYIFPEGPKPVSMWTTMNDEQKIWIAGSYFQYSAFGGWENILGIDLLGTTGSTQMKFDLPAANAGLGTAYAVQASKVSKELDLPFPPPLSDNELFANWTANLTSYLDFRMFGARNIEKQDRRFVALRLASEYSKNSEQPDPAAISTRVSKLSEIYSILKDVKDSVIPPAVKALLAYFLSVEWQNTDKEKTALARALGVQPPDEDFWLPVSKLTALIPPKQKIFLLLDLLPFISKSDVNIAAVYPKVLGEINSVLKDRLPQVSEAKLQSFASDLLVSDFLKEGSDPEKILRFVRNFPSESLLAVIEESIKQLELAVNS